jgi:hypothetical protein
MFLEFGDFELIFRDKIALPAKRSIPSSLNLLTGLFLATL